MDIQFVRDNPALEQYNKQQKIARDEEAQDVKNKYLTTNTAATQQGMQQSAAEAPTRLRLLGSQADTSAATASKTQTEAQYAPQEIQSRIANTFSEMNARQASTAMNVYNMQIQRAEAGDIQGAKAVATAAGVKGIPDDVLANAQASGAMKNIIATAQTQYPGRPKDQLMYITSKLAEMSRRQQQGQQVNPQQAPYMQAPDTPTPPDVAQQKNQHAPPANVATAEWLVKNGIAKDVNEAWGMAREAVQKPEAIKAQLWNRAVQASAGDMDKAKALYSQGLQFVTGAGKPAADGAPPAAAVAALRAQPQLAAQFDAKFGAGAAARILNAPAQTAAPAQPPPQVPVSQ